MNFSPQRKKAGRKEKTLLAHNHPPGQRKRLRFQASSRLSPATHLDHPLADYIAQFFLSDSVIYYKSYVVMMKNSQERNTAYTSISKSEARLLGVIKEKDLAVFSVEEVRSLTGWNDVKIHNTLRTLDKKGAIIRIKRNCYALESIVSERSLEIATEVVKPSYISFWTALSYYGFTEQQVKLVQLVSTKQVNELNVGPYPIEVTTFRPRAFYGYHRVERFAIAEKEKVLVDSLYQPDKCGGLDEFAKCLRNSWSEIDQMKLAEYTIRFGNRSLSSRMGYLIETLGLKVEGMTERVIPHRSESYVKLSPGNGRIVGHNDRWKIIVNHDIKMEKIV